MRLPTTNELAPLLLELRKTLAKRPDAVHAKHANDFVTEKDLYVQQYLKNELAARYPDIAFLGEEGEAAVLDPAVPTFVLDPIDGTTNFVFGYGLSAISLALVFEGRPVLGLVFNPYTCELFAAERGKGATLNGAPIHVHPAAALSEVVAAVGTMPYRKEYADELFLRMRRTYDACIDIRRSGSAALDLCYVAAGRVGLYFERGLSLWDYAAGALIVEEAGGRVTDHAGNPVPFTGSCDIAASNGALHEKLLSELLA